MGKAKRKSQYMLTQNGWILATSMPIVCLHIAVALIFCALTGEKKIAAGYGVMATALGLTFLVAALVGDEPDPPLGVPFLIAMQVFTVPFVIGSLLAQINWGRFVVKRPPPRTENDDYFSKGRDA